VHEDSNESQITALTTSATAIIQCHTARLRAHTGGDGGGAETVDPRDVAPLVRVIASHVRLSHLTVHGAHGAAGRGTTLVDLLRLTSIWHGVDLANATDDIHAIGKDLLRSSTVLHTAQSHLRGRGGGSTHCEMCQVKKPQQPKFLD